MSSDASGNEKYEAPQLVELGSLDDLTRGNVGGVADAGLDGSHS